MKYEIKEVRATKKKVEIEVSAEDFNNYYSQTLKKISADAEIPGFRKGKAPEDMVESRVTKEGVLSEAAEMAIRESWARFLAESKEEAISQPQVEIIKIAKDNPLIFTAEFEILPLIKLPKLDSAKVEKSSVEVTDQEVEDAIKWIQQSRAKYSEKISGAEDGDLVEFTFSCLDIENDPEKKDRIVLGKGH
ncbi:MAG TPA: trigger factor family protein, partial [Candidatus Paceibacterota bacterium]|nr:trigger factor family protein [Candidatus Paceibacterota bacterium]